MLKKVFLAGVAAGMLSGYPCLAGAPLSGLAAPVPFSDAYRDGYVFVVWGDPTDAEVDTMLDRIGQAGARHLTIPWFGCQSDIHSSDVGSCMVIERIDSTRLADRAVAKGFDVSFLPIVETPHWEWRGFFDPTDVDRWFASYLDWMKGVARESKRIGARELIVGSEFSKLYRYESRWSQLLNELRGEFDGPLVVTVNWSDLEHSFWADADAIGVSAYYPLSVNDHPSQDELDRAWAQRSQDLLAVSRRWSRPLHITEVGYQSTASAAKTPWSTPDGDPSDLDLQARCFEAFRKAWQGERAMVRANVWATSVEDPAGETFPFSFETVGKPAEGTLKQFFAGRAALLPGSR